MKALPISVLVLAFSISACGDGTVNTSSATPAAQRPAAHKQATATKVAAIDPETGLGGLPRRGLGLAATDQELYEAYNKIRWGKDGMIAGPPLFTSAQILRVAKFAGLTASGIGDPALWSWFNARYGFVGDTSAASGVPYGLTPFMDGFYTNCFACHVANVDVRTGVPPAVSIVKIPWIGAPNQDINIPKLARDLVTTGLSTSDGLRLIAAYDLAKPMLPPQNPAFFFGWLTVTSRSKSSYAFTGLPGILQNAFNQFLSSGNPYPLADRWLPANVMPWWWSKGKASYSSGYGLHDPRSDYLVYGQMYHSPEIAASRLLPGGDMRESFKQLATLVNGITPPETVDTVNYAQANAGEVVFNSSCAHCHNSERIVAVGTDEAMSRAFDPLMNEWNARPYFGFDVSTMKNADYVLGGYRAPPLTAIWVRRAVFHDASATLASLGTLTGSRHPYIGKLSDGERSQVYEYLKVRCDVEPDPYRATRDFRICGNDSVEVSFQIVPPDAGTVTWEARPDKFVCDGPAAPGCRDYADDHEIVSAIAQPKAGYRFTSWSGSSCPCAGSTANLCSYSVIHDTSCQVVVNGYKLSCTQCAATFATTDGLSTTDVPSSVAAPMTTIAPPRETIVEPVQKPTLPVLENTEVAPR